MSPVDISSKAPLELELLLPQETLSSRHFAAMALASIAIHIVAIVSFLSLPDVALPSRAPVVTADLRKAAVHLVAPKMFEPTQKAPNLSKVVRPELDIRSEIAAPQPQTPRMRRPQPAPGPIAPPPPAPPPPPMIEPPKIQIATAQPPVPPTVAPPASPTGTTTQASPPPASSKPKLSFENVAPPPPVKVLGPVDPTVLMQMAAAERAAQNSTKPPGGGGITVGDSGDDLANLPRLDQAQSKGRVGSNLQLLSDASGFDFKPYLMQVLASVRRHWMAVMPETVKTGRRGQVLIQFIIDRRGSVPKLVIATSSGTEAFDRAAVAGVSASNPFPPLPADFKGDQIRLQLAFSYNAPSR